MITKILVPTDGSDQANHALKFAIESAIKWDAQIIVLSVIPPLRPIMPESDGFDLVILPEFEEGLEKAYQSILDEAVKKVVNEQPKIGVKSILEKGRPANVIVNVARNENVDLIVMGSRGLGGITGTVLGSTSQAVVHLCTRPILIVK